MICFHTYEAVWLTIYIGIYGEIVFFYPKKKNIIIENGIWGEWNLLFMPLENDFMVGMADDDP